MITWILGTLVIIWCLVARFREGGKIEGQPLGMPKGTVRAIITLMIVSFPFSYLLEDQEIPGVITNAIFILVAFYFEARKGGENRLKLIKEVKNPEKTKEEKKREKKPLYLPKYTVRISLLLIIVLIVLINAFGPMVPFETTNTLFDILVIICLYFVGTFFRAIGLARQRKKLKKQIETIPDYQSLSKYEILAKIDGQKPSWWLNKGKSIFSVLIFIAVFISLLSFTLNWDYTIYSLPFYEITIRNLLLLLVNVYYGFRD